ncbi:MAG TPA: lactate utilization protein C [Burkholderiales bacterium]|nr:lactate utilization protein C [Burkholderiales bacterium]
MSARENILRRIREANGREAGETAGRRIAIRKKLDDRSRGPLPTMAWEPVPHFKERCIAMMSTVSEVESLDGVPHALASYLKANQLPATGVCWAEFAALNWAGSGLTIEARPSHAEDKLGITGVFCALAENGTLMLLSGETTPATTSLLPETHVAVVPFSRIVRTMEDGWDLLRRERGVLPRQVNFISGPSRTADIEMTLVLGAHGPFRVHVILVTR